jgi:hypothetical protein
LKEEPVWSLDFHKLRHYSLSPPLISPFGHAMNPSSVFAHELGTLLGAPILASASASPDINADPIPGGSTVTPSGTAISELPEANSSADTLPAPSIEPTSLKPLNEENLDNRLSGTPSPSSLVSAPAEGISVQGTQPQDLGHTLRYYDDDVDGQNEYPPDSDSCLWSAEPFVALVDTHVRFAQETLLKLDTEQDASTLHAEAAAVPLPVVVELGPAPSPSILLRPVSPGACRH